MAVATASKKHRNIEQVKPDRFRRDIQGLRAVAVVAVIANHLFDWPRGGFDGVDIFFVISGFLITGLLLREHENTGSISWSGFYRRRIRRIMPASTLVLAVTVAASYFVYRTARFDSIRTDAIWSFFFASNYHFADVGTDYWQASGPVSPLRNFWSLAVEEQFYLAWPVIAILVLGVVGRGLRRRGRSPLTILMIVVALLTLLSFLYGLRHTTQNPTEAYFSTFARGWELGVGALLSVFAAALRRIPAWSRPFILWTGLAGIAASFTLLSSTSRIPAPDAALPVVAAALVIAAGIGHPPRYAFLLTNPVSSYIGKISYSLYLWHFPVVILLGSLMDPTSATYYVVVIVGTAVLSIAAFHLIEDPIRRSGWLEPGVTRTPRMRKRRGISHRPKLGYTGLAVMTVIVGGLVIKSLVPATPVNMAALTQSAVAVSTSTAVGVPLVAGPESALGAEIETALRATSWPADLDPSIDQAQSFVFEGICGAPAAICDVNTKAGETAYVLGDSLADRLVLTARTAMHADYFVQSKALASCFMVTVDAVYTSADKKISCLAHRADVIADVKKTKPAVVFIIDTYAYTGRLASGATGTAAATEWAAGLSDLLMNIKNSARKIIVVSPPPEGATLANCAEPKGSRPVDCLTQIPSAWHQISVAEQEVANRSGVIYWDTSRWFCSAAGYCPAFVGTTLIRYDNVHPTSQFLNLLVPLFSEKLRLALA